MEATRFVIGPLEVHGVRWPGPTGATERPVLLVHGLGGCTIEWESVGGRLAAELRTDVYAVDLPGFGRTRLPRGSAAIPRHVGAVTAVLDELGPSTLVGNSMGGLVSMAVAAQRPASVAALVLVDPALVTGGGSSPTVRTAARYAIALTPVVGPAVISRLRRRAGAERYVADRLAAIVHDPDRIAAEVRARLVEQATERAAYAEASRCYSAAARSIFTGLRGSWRVTKSLTAPTLVIHGAHDALVPVGLVDRLRALRPDWAYEVFDDAGHLPHLEIPERFVQTVRAWMAERAAA